MDIDIRFDGDGDLFGPLHTENPHIPDQLVKWLAQRSEYHARLRAFAGDSLPRRALVTTLVGLLLADGIVFHEENVKQQALIAQSERLAANAEELAEAYNLTYLALPELVVGLIAHHADGPTRAAYLSGFLMQQAPVWPFRAKRPKAA